MCCGRLFFQTTPLSYDLPKELPGGQGDNAILGVAISLQKTRTDRTIILASKDINLHIKTTVLGICGEDYYNDKVLGDVDLLYRGCSELEAGFWGDLNNLESGTENGWAL